jgi:hypothetical protein
LPATLKSITSKTNTVAVAIDDDPQGITVTYTTRKVTAGAMKGVHELLTSDPSGMDALIEQVLLFVTAWDLRVDDGGAIVPLDKKNLEKLVPVEIMALVVEAVTADQSPKEATDG